MTRFEQFQQNVQRWATERGIYEHSTALAQALKAVSEVGELCDAVVKNDRDALIDAIGDTAVCLVNVGAMRGLKFDLPYAFEQGPFAARVTLQFAAAQTAVSAGLLAEETAELGGTDEGYADGLLLSLFCTARVAKLNFDDCCESAWQTIKDRKGRMVAGGAFVKEGE